MPHPVELSMIVRQPNMNRFGHGDLTVLSAFGIADQQDPCRQINILNAQQAGFRAAQTAGVDSPEQDWHDQMPQRHVAAVMAAIRLGKEGGQFRVGINVRSVGRRPTQQACR